MTQDPYGQPPGTGYVVHGEVVPDGEAVTPPTAPMTHFQKVASALRGDQTDPAMPAYVPSDQEASPAGPQPPDSDRTWLGADQDDADQDDADRDATRPEEIVAARSPDAGSHDYWDDADGTGAEQAATQDSTAAQPDLHGATAHAETGTAGTEPEAMGKHAGVPAPEGSRAGESDHGPGDFSDLLPDAAEFRTRWRQVQFRFVDDPQGSVTEAADVIAQVTAKLEAAIAERQRALRGRWGEGKNADTESLRETLLMYRAFLDQLTGPRDG